MAVAESIKQTFPVTGMSCAACASNIEHITKKQEGIIDAAVNFAGATLHVEFDPEKITPADMQQSIRSIGYDMVIEEVESREIDLIEEKQRQHLAALKRGTIGAMLLSVPIVVISMIFPDIPFANYLMWALATPVLSVFGRRFYSNAWQQTRHGRANMDTLVALSTSIAYLFSVFNTLFPGYLTGKGLEAHVYFEAAAVIITFILLGKWFEEKAKARTSSAIKKLMELRPETVIKISADGSEISVPVSEIQKDDLLLVKPGDKIPVDGEVISGTSFIDESMISGEPIPVEKMAGKELFTGTINQKGSLHIRAKKVGKETILAQMIQMVREAQGSKAPVQRLADKVAGIFVPIVMIISIISFITWLLAGGENAFTHGVLSMVTVLVIACPCALGLATPTAIMVGVGKGAENGILIKNAQGLEQMQTINAIILDKTGTITEGKPVVTDAVWQIRESDRKHFRQVLYTIETHSEHPLANAVAKHLKKESQSHVMIKKFTSLTGKGVAVIVDDQKYFVGNEKLLEEQRIILPDQFAPYLEKWHDEGKTVIYFFNQNAFIAAFAIADKIKDSSKKAVEALHAKGITVYMVTGDHARAAAAIAGQAGITNYYAGTLPADKAEFARQLQDQGKRVAMVGDGINDAHALAQADVGIAMGKGSDIAMDVAKMTIISSDLSKIARAIDLSRRTMRTVRQNLFWAFIYNIIGIPLAAGILYPFYGFLLNPMIAGAAMALSSVSVVSNSLRLKWVKI